MLERDPLLNLAYEMTSADVTSRAEHARRAFELAHHARRLIENAAEVASRNRWPILEQSKYRPERRDARYAQRVADAMLKDRYPVRGEPVVYAALLDVVDRLVQLSAQLYAEWLETQPRVEPLPVPEGANRLGEPMAPGCARVIPVRGEE